MVALYSRQTQGGTSHKAVKQLFFSLTMQTPFRVYIAPKSKGLFALGQNIRLRGIPSNGLHPLRKSQSRSLCA